MTAVDGRRASRPRAVLATPSSARQRTPACAGMPPQTARTARSPASSRAAARERLRSCATRLPARTAASMAAPAAIPTPTRTIRSPRRASRERTKRRMANIVKHQHKRYAGVVGRKPPRYDVPKAAPRPLRLVQHFVNTGDHENAREWLGSEDEVEAWLVEHGLPSTGADAEHARVVREAF